MRVVVNKSSLGFGGHGPVKNRAIRKFNARRKVLPGYPWEGEFKTKAEVAEYLGGDKIICLLCGAAKQKLGSHLLRLHAMSADQYRARYGLPWRTGVASAKCRANHKEAHSGDVEALRERAAKSRAAMRVNPPKHRKLSQAILSSLPERVNYEGRKPVLAYPDSAFVEFIARMRSGRPATSVGQDDDMPRVSAVHKRRKINPAFAAEFEAALAASRAARLPRKGYYKTKLMA